MGTRLILSPGLYWVGKMPILQTPFNTSRFYCILNMRKISTFWKSGNNCYLQRGITLLYIISRLGDQINFKPSAVFRREQASKKALLHNSWFYLLLYMSRILLFLKKENNWDVWGGITLKLTTSKIPSPVFFYPKDQLRWKIVTLYVMNLMDSTADI